MGALCGEDSARGGRIPTFCHLWMDTMLRTRPLVAAAGLTSRGIAKVTPAQAYPGKLQGGGRATQAATQAELATSEPLIIKHVSCRIFRDTRQNFIVASSFMAIRRNARLRREYLYKKSLEGKEKEQFERKERLKQALQEGKQIPADLAKDAGKLRAELEMDDLRTSVPRSHVDDEYALAGVRDPKVDGVDGEVSQVGVQLCAPVFLRSQVCITTSRDPSSRLKQFTSEVSCGFCIAECAIRSLRHPVVYTRPAWCRRRCGSCSPTRSA